MSPYDLKHAEGATVQGWGRVKIFTVGFTKKSAETFFTRLKKSGAKRIVDVRLNNISQLAGFAREGTMYAISQRQFCF